MSVQGKMILAFIYISIILGIGYLLYDTSTSLANIINKEYAKMQKQIDENINNLKERQ